MKENVQKMQNRKKKRKKRTEKNELGNDTTQPGAV